MAYIIVFLFVLIVACFCCLKLLQDEVARIHKFDLRWLRESDEQQDQNIDWLKRYT